MKRAEVIEQLESGCLPRFESIANALRSKHPEFRIVVGSGSVGSKTTFQGHFVFIECDRQGSANPEPNCVALEVCIRDLDGTPMLCTLDFTWGGDGVAPCDSVTYLTDPILWSDDAMRLVESQIPLLASDLNSCLEAWEHAYLRNAEAQQGA
jgi:hypothetical protein